jgi:Outer membrane protein beta-barrel domain
MRVTSCVQLIAGVLVLPLYGAVSQQLSVGARVAASTAGFATAGPWGARLGGEFGAVAMVPLTHEILLEPELKLVRRGANTVADGGTVVDRLSLTYLELPVLVRWQPRSGELSFIHPVLHAGPALSVLLSCRYTYEREPPWYSPVPEGLSTSCESRLPQGAVRPLVGIPFAILQRIDLAAVVGGGIAFDLGRSLLTIDVRFTRGFLPVDRLVFSDARNEAWTIGLAWSRVW